MPLSDLKIRNAKPAARPYKLSDEKGLYMLVQPTGGKLWRLNYRVSGKQKTLALGAYPETTLAAAREKLLEARRLLASGVDPGEVRKAQKSASAERAAHSFEVIAREWHTKFSPRWAESHSKRILRRLEKDIFPWLGNRPVSEISAPELLKVLRLAESRGAVETSHRIGRDCGQVFRYAVATGRAERDPTADLRGALAPISRGHFAAITKPEDLAQLLRVVHDYKGDFVTRQALKLWPLVMLRSSELCRLEWCEVDLDKALITVKGERMKTRRWCS